MINVNVKSFEDFLDILPDEPILQQEVSKSRSLEELLEIAKSNGYYKCYGAREVIKNLVEQEKHRKKGIQQGSISLRGDAVDVTLRAPQLRSKGSYGLRYLSLEVLQQVADDSNKE